MAQRRNAVADQPPGPFFVDASCIDCGTCYQFAPETFADAGGHSRVKVQPADRASILRASMALVACPTASIGSEDKRAVAEASRAFPDPVDTDVRFCGYTAESSFGAWSWLILRPAGNVLVDSPRFAEPLARRIEELGGVSLMVLSHRDDVADHAKWRERFGCQRLAHAAEGLRGIEREVEGQDLHPLGPDLVAVPTPGHTAGSLCLLHRDRHLFTGDHLWWNPERRMLSASPRYCWYHWPTQLRSLERLLELDFSWVLPGHGALHRSPDAVAMRGELEAALAWLKARA